MPSTKPEVNNVLHCHQRTEPWPQVTRTKDMAKYGCVVSQQANRQTYRHTDRNTSHPTRSKVITNSQQKISKF